MASLSIRIVILASQSDLPSGLLHIKRSTSIVSFTASCATGCRCGAGWSGCVVRRGNIQVRTRIPAGLRPECVRGRRHELRSGLRCPAPQESGLWRRGPRRLGPAHRELVADMRIQCRQWSARRLRKVPPMLETRSDCARVPTAAWKTAAPTTSHSPVGGLTRNDEPAGGYLVKALPQPAVVHRPPADRLRRRLACLDQGLGRSRQGTGPRLHFRHGRAVSMAGPYGPPASPVVHKYLNNQSLVSNQGLDSANPDSYHCCCFYSFGEVEEEVVREPRRPGSGPAMRSRSRKRRGPIPARFREGEAGTAGPVRNA